MHNKKPLAVLLAMACTLGTYAQVKDEHITNDGAFVKYKLGGAVEYLSKERSYKVVAPDAAGYHNGKDNAAKWGYLGLSMDAKKAKGDNPASKTFEIRSAGLTLLAKYEDMQAPFPANPAVKGWVRKVYFSFPVKILVKDSVGKTEKELIIAADGKENSTVFHAGILPSTAPKPAPAQPAAPGVFGPDPAALARQITPFAKLEDLQKAFDANKPAIENIMERTEAEKLTKAVVAAIYAGYDYNKYGKATIPFYKLKSKDAGDFAKLVATTEKFKNSLNDLEEEPKQADAMKAMQECYLDYKEQIANAAGIFPDVIKMCLTNGAMAALITGNLEDANQWYAQYYVAYKNKANSYYESQIDNSFELLYAMYASYYLLKQNKAATANLDAPIAAFGAKAAADDIAMKENLVKDSIAKAEAEARNPNVKGVPGYVVLKSGEKAEGKVYITFRQEGSSGIVDLDLGKTVTVEAADGKKKDYGVKNVSYFVAKEQRFEPLDVKEAAVFGIMAKVSGDFGKLHFYKSDYQKGAFTVFQDPASGIIVIRKAGDAQAYQAADVLKNRKPAKSFIESCDALKKKAEEKDGLADVTDARQLADWLSDNCN